MSPVTSGFASGAGSSVHYLDCRPDGVGDGVGDGAGEGVPPILFVPGVTDVADDYRTIAQHTGRRTIVVELRGHGRTRATGGWSLEHHVDDIAAVVDAVVDGPLHLMTFSRGTCYALGWLAGNADRVRSLTIGDYPAREIGFPPGAADRLLDSTWRGTPVTERVDPDAFRQIFAESRDRSLWHVVAALDVPVAVVRSSAPAPISDDDWEQYATVSPGIRRERYDDSPHDIFRVDRGRFARLAAETAAEGDRLADA